MFEAAKLRPVVIDESLTDLETLKLAREMGYTGAALKACKGQSQTLLMAAAHAEVQDVPLRAGPHLPGRGAGAFGRDRQPLSGVSGLEANAREYVPAANRAGRRNSPASSKSRTAGCTPRASTVPACAPPDHFAPARWAGGCRNVSSRFAAKIVTAGISMMADTGSTGQSASILQS